MEIIGNPAKSQILKFLSANPGAYFGLIQNALPEMNVNTLARHLRSLEEAGVIDLDLPRGQRRGRTPRYTVNRAAVVDMTNEWLAYLDMNLRPTGPEAEGL